MGNSFNLAPDHLPSSLTHLTFGYEFNQPVDRLPSSLTHLTFGNYFKQSVNSLPSTLTHLTFGHCFNGSVDNLPCNLHSLHLGALFDQPLNNLPQLTRLSLHGIRFSHSFQSLPTSITYFNFGLIIEDEDNIAHPQPSQQPDFPLLPALRHFHFRTRNDTVQTLRVPEGTNEVTFQTTADTDEWETQAFLVNVDFEKRTIFVSNYLPVLLFFCAYLSFSFFLLFCFPFLLLLSYISLTCEFKNAARLAYLNEGRWKQK